LKFNYGGETLIIKQILNNNAIITLDNSQNIQIVLGKGIAFQKKVGDWLPESNKLQFFTLKEAETTSKIKQLLNEIDLDAVEIADNIIKYAKSQIGQQLNENIYITLSDHINSSIKRYKEGTLLPNSMLNEIKQFYKIEYQIGMKALELIKEKYDICLPEGEAGFIALHIVNAEVGGQMNKMNEITVIMQEILNIIELHFRTSFDENSIYYNRFITHLKFFAHRIINGKQLKDEDETEELYMLIKNKYYAAFECVLKIKEFIINKYKYTISQEEQTYLTIHINRLVYKNR